MGDLHENCTKFYHLIHHVLCMLSICQYVDLNKCNKTNLLHSLNTFFNYSDRPILGTYSESAKNGLFRQIDILGQITFSSCFLRKTA